MYRCLVEAFECGDIVFGLYQPRSIVLSLLRNKYNDSPRYMLPSVFFGCCSKRDTYKRIYIQNDLTNAVWDIDKLTEYSSDKILKKNRNYDRLKGFRNFLAQHQKYNVAAQATQAAQIVQAARDAQTQGAQIQALNALLACQSQGWKRASKAGLEYQLIQREKTVHFIIDGLDFYDIGKKQGFGNSITSSELRWLYRNRRRPCVVKGIRFWDKNKEYPSEYIFSKLSGYIPREEFR